jgi:hypothetical protein
MEQRYKKMSISMIWIRALNMQEKCDNKTYIKDRQEIKSFSRFIAYLKKASKKCGFQ